MIIQNKLKRAISVEQLERMNFEIMEFEGDWKDSFGTPEKSGAWIIYGKSGHGKTRFTMKLCKYLTKFGTVGYNTIEEGARASMQKAQREVGMKAVKSRFKWLNRETRPELYARLKKRRSPDIIVIDSIQYFDVTRAQFHNMLVDFPNKLFIFISHSEGKEPEGKVAQKVKYHSDLKIHVEGYRAFNIGRMGGRKPFTIWEEGALEYWGEVA